MQPVRIERTRGPNPELENVAEEPRTMIFCDAHFKTCIYVCFSYAKCEIVLIKAQGLRNVHATYQCL